MTAAPIHVAGERLMLDPAGVLHWPARRTLVVADLHLEKGSSFAAAGRFLPPYDTRETLERLALLLRRWRPVRIIALGDSFHDRGGAARLPLAEAEALRRMLAGLEMVWVLGNHDPDPPEGLPGLAAEEFTDGRLVFRHQALPPASRFATQPGAEISGHFHPKATMATRAGGITRPCFLADGRRVMLPAFGAFTGGLDVRDPAIADLFPRGARAFLLGRERLFSMPTGPCRMPAVPAPAAPFA
ncbi:ligase-associated DNA damage response endonuclease PdeM [Paeniroseomonas aquatica]|uniref:Ligase-associated DNA damage response endonuclease PdeM n=1 Tax=Paeniroseomonas aquatica TaxID=373043 RepID=A0ABT8A5P1_9PROT|nr:ligase-associated DNA damage response endonuclease PdeM [Paeniroseomonas aquatica]MDN3565011.1 ligase-associated DNA damage response endonuclease PdeM [Paeniroseomonas aquatica]